MKRRTDLRLWLCVVSLLVLGICAYPHGALAELDEPSEPVNATVPADAVAADEQGEPEAPASSVEKHTVSVTEDASPAEEPAPVAVADDADDESSIDDPLDEEDIVLTAAADGDETLAWTTCGTCEWAVSNGGELVIRPKSGDVGTLASWNSYLTVPWYDKRSSITSVRFERTIKAVTCLGFFLGFEKLAAIDLTNLDTSQVTNMQLMFSGCRALTSIDLSSLDTSHVTSMGSMFHTCSGLTSLDLSGLDTSQVTSMYSMFLGCSALTSLDLSVLDMSSNKSTGTMFSGCSALTSLCLDGLDTSQVTDMTGMFANCSKLASLDVSGFDTGSVTNMTTMFYNCSALTSLDLSRFDTRSLTQMERMLSGCRNLQSVNLSSFDTSGVTNMKSLFYNCSALTSLDLSNIDTSSATALDTMFYGCSRLASITLGAGFSFCGATSDRLVDFPTGIWVPQSSNLPYQHNAIPNNTANTYAKSSDWTASGSCAWCIVEGALEVVPLNGATEGSLVSWSDHYGVPWRKKVADIKTASFAGTVHVPNCAEMFYGCTGMTSIDLTGLDTSSATTMQGMFNGCSSLTSIDLSALDTSAVTDMGDMFVYCLALESIDLAGLNTSSVTSTAGMFRSCSSLTSLDLSTLDMPAATDMSSMFSGCAALEALAVSALDTSAVTDMSYMLSGCSSLASVILTGLDTSSVTDMSGMFSGCSSLTSLDLSVLNTSAVTDMSSVFNGCSSLASVSLTGLDTSSVTDMGSMFRGCSGLTSLDLSALNTSAVTSMISMFYGCRSLQALDLMSFDTTSVTDMSSMFYGCSALTELNLSGFDTTSAPSMTNMLANCSGLNSITLGERFVGADFMLPAGIWVAKTSGLPYQRNAIPSGEAETYEKSAEWTTSLECAWRILDGTLEVVPLNGAEEGFLTEWTTPSQVPWYNKRAEISAVRFRETVRVHTCHSMFSGCTALTSADLSGLDTSSATSCHSMFNNCSSLETLDLSCLDMASVTDMRSMFDGCASLRALNVSGLTMASVTDMVDMFNGCAALTALDLSDLDTTSVTKMNAMFNGCSSLATINLSGFDTTSVTDMTEMFCGCSALTKLDLSSFDTSAVVYMGSLFKNCSSLEALDLSNFVTSSTINMGSMFLNCSSLAELNLASFDTAAADMSNMLNGCTALRSLTIGERFVGASSVMPNGIWVATSSNLPYKKDAIPDGVAETYEMSDWAPAGECAWRIVDGTLEVVPLNGAEEGSLNAWSYAYLVPWDERRAEIEHVDLRGTIHAKSCMSMFSSCTALTELDLTNLDISTATVTMPMFTNCPALSKLVIGDSYVLSEDTFPDATANEGWWSCEARAWMTKDEIIARGSMADTYTNYCALTDISEAQVAVIPARMPYGAVEQRPDVTVTLTDGTQVAPENLEVSYFNNIGVGTATVVVRGINDCRGETSATFEITKGIQTITADGLSLKVGAAVGQMKATASAGGALSYESQDVNVAKVSDTGEVVPIGAGSTTVMVRAAETDLYAAAELPVTVTVAKGSQTIKIAVTEAAIGKKVKLKAATSGDGKLTYKSSNKKIATVTKSGVIKGIKAGKVKITVTAADTKNYNKVSKTFTIKVGKANTMSAKASKRTVTCASPAKKARTLESNIVVANAVGRVSYANASTNATAKTFTVNSKTGKVTVPKGTKAGTYKIKVKVKAKGNKTYISGSKTVTYTIKVK